MIPMADLAAVLRHPHTFESLCDRYGVAEVVEALRIEGVAPYLAWLRPDAVPLADDRRRAVLAETVQRVELTRVCAHLAGEGIAAAIFKGGAVAYTDYPEAWCRPSIDIDLLVAPEDRDHAFNALGRLGYTRAGRLPGEFVNGQDVFERVIGAGATMVIDLHWHVSNRLWLRRLLPTVELLGRSVPAPFAGGAASRISDEDALLIACLHPAAHHSRHTLLKWSLDVARMAARWPGEDVERFASRARSLEVSALVAHALRAAQPLVDAELVPLLRTSTIAGFEAAGAADSSRVWLDPRRDQLQDALDDFRALRGWRDRGRLIREHLWPPASFMRAQYGHAPRVTLPALYLHRIVSGGAKWTYYWIRDRWISRSATSRGADPAASAAPPRDVDF